MFRSMMAVLYTMSALLIFLSVAHVYADDAPIEKTPAPPAESKTTVSASETFQKGLSAYQNKQYAEAREAFQKVLDQNTQESKLSVGVLHNLALSALQLDQKPWALALWRKALSVRPGFRPARVGRDMLESKMQMRPFERDSFNLWVHRMLESLSFYEILWLNALLLGITGWLGIRYWSQRRSALDSEMTLPGFPTAAMLISILLVGSFGLMLFKSIDMMTPRATVVAAKSGVHSLPSNDSAGLYDVSGGSEVLVRRNQGDWTQVQTPDGNSGWVKSTDIFITSGR